MVVAGVVGDVARGDDPSSELRFLPEFNVNIGGFADCYNGKQQA